MTIADSGFRWLGELEEFIMNRMHEKLFSPSDWELYEELENIEGNLHDLLFDWRMHLRVMSEDNDNA